jgi:hypothetical protein
MAALAEFIARLIAERVRLAAGVPGPAGRVIALLRELGPYAAIELILPGGSLLALLLWLWRRRRGRAWYVAHTP